MDQGQHTHRVKHKSGVPLSVAHNNLRIYTTPAYQLNTYRTTANCSITAPVSNSRVVAHACARGFDRTTHKNMYLRSLMLSLGTVPVVRYLILDEPEEVNT
jgi:hypothetical protein